MDFELASFVVTAGKTFITLRVQNFMLANCKLKVKPYHVARYFFDYGGRGSTVRSLAGLYGDWRQMDDLAQYCFEYFKAINPTLMRRETKKLGLLPNF